MGVIKFFGAKKVFVIYLICQCFTLATMIGSAITSLWVGALAIEKMIEHVLLCVLTVVLLHIPMVARTKFRLKMPQFFQIIVTVFIVAHFVLGEIYRFYDYIFLFDKVLHTTAGVVIALSGFSIVYAFSKSKDGVRLSPFFVALFSFCFAIMLLTLWEIFEYSMDAIFKLNMQRWQDGLSEVIIDGKNALVTDSAQGSGLIDTMTDIIVGTVGALVISVSGGLWVKRKPDDTSFYIVKEKK
ncbi:MAG: hypothetical protein FWE84_00210 [Firmicutes bacterium]|nr:hypothetical protein [Bacillota bacterium]